MLRILIITGLINLLIRTGEPFLCSGLYTAAWVAGSLMYSAPLTGILIGGVIVFGVTSLYFWLLNRFQEGITWWAIMVPGLVVLLFF